MANAGELPDLDLKMPSLDLELPEPTLNLDIPDIGMGAPAGMPMPGAAPAPNEVPPAGKQAAKPAGKPGKGNGKGKKSGTGRPVGPSGNRLSIVLNVICVVLLLGIVVVMYVFNVPVNMVPDLSLTTYVQSLWLLIGCFFVVAMLHDLKMGLILTGLDIAMLITIFPTIWLLMDTPMNPMYFFVMGMVVLQLVIALPLGIINARKQPAKKSAPAGAGAPTAPVKGPNPSS
ncbi:MAG: hypothetical protein NC238_10495 [Dehalobacter sp.]|nr:hypothetical protein [Dehalobacter sp.]